jgi:hypothetical protein
LIADLFPHSCEDDEEELANQLHGIAREVTQDGRHCKVLKYCLPVVRCVSKEGQVVGEKVLWIMELMGGIQDKVKFITTDHGSENKSAIKHAFQGNEDIVEIYCAIHALNLSLTYGCDTFDDKAKKKEKMSNKCLTQLDFVINLLRRYWSEIKVNSQCSVNMLQCGTVCRCT